jgi:UDP-3-O-[3-hydroxymyristoyl] N-acetylglucosamine deacetylase/3-hydroxyacyl-[acyl-carrier-protein] dehydratase
VTNREPASYYKQHRTLDGSVEFSGVGLHTGEETSVELEPASADQGLVFERVDVDSSPRIDASLENVVDYPRSTVLGNGEHRIHTVEHLLASLFALGISDVTIKVDGPEVPALDGSAAEFCQGIEEVGTRELEEDRPIYRVKEPVFVRADDSSIAILPNESLSVSSTVSYEDREVGDQFVSTTIAPGSFTESIAPARTYGFRDEVEDLLDRDLAQGGSLENALVIEEGEYLGDGPRIDREMARHKIIDLLGDLALVGTFFVGHVVAVKNGHDMNVNLGRKLHDKVKRSPQVINHRVRNVDEEGLDIDDIKGVLPHRYPFLLLDRILMVDNEEYFAQGLKNVTMNELFFQGHFPDDPVMPGVLVLEAMAQLGAAVILNQPENASKNSYFMGVDDVKWRRPVRPGDQLLLESEALRFRPGAKMGKMKGEAFVDGESAAEGVFKFALVED